MGSNKINMALANSILTSYGLETDPKITETITALGSLKGIYEPKGNRALDLWILMQLLTRPPRGNPAYGKELINI